MTRRIKPLSKGNELLSSLLIEFPKLHSARLKFIVLFTLAVTKVGLVQLGSIAAGFDSAAEQSSSLKRIKRFLKEVSLDYGRIAEFLVKLLGLDKESKWILSLDRTDWKFGSKPINIMMLGICGDSMAIPLLWSLLNKKGISNQKERIDLIKIFISIFGKHRIEYIVADREFIGIQWFKYLIKEEIKFAMRLKENFYVIRNGEEIQLAKLFRSLAVGQTCKPRKPYYLKGNKVYLTVSRINTDELLIIASPYYESKALHYYSRRWEIETLFKALKTQGFNMETSHISDPVKFKKLLALLAIAFVWAYKTGVFLNQIKPIKIIESTGKRVYSIFKYGFKYLRNLLLNSYREIELKRLFTVLSTY